MASVKILKRIVLTILFILGIASFAIITKMYVNYKNLNTCEFEYFRKYLGLSLQNYYFEYYKAPANLSVFVNFLESQDSSVMKRFGVKNIDFLKNNRKRLHIRTLKSMKRIVLYFSHHGNFDTLCGNFNQESFFEYLFNPQADKIISWANYSDICEIGKFEYKFFQKGKTTNSIELNKTVLDTINPDIQRFIMANVVTNDNIYLLYNFVLNDTIWDGRIVCNWNDVNNDIVIEIKNQLLIQLHKKNISQLADNIYYPLVYTNK